MTTYETAEKIEEEMGKDVSDILSKYKDKNVLEIGCGNGRFLSISEKFEGFDNESRFIEKGIKNYGNRIWVGELFNEIPRKEYDLVFSTGLIEHYDKPNEAVREHLRFLKDNGICIIFVPASGLDGWLQVKTLLAINPNADFHEYGKRVSKKELIRYCEMEGLKQIETYRIGDTIRGSPKWVKPTQHPVLFTLHSIAYILQKLKLTKLFKRKFGSTLVFIGEYNK